MPQSAGEFRARKVRLLSYTIAKIKLHENVERTERESEIFIAWAPRFDSFSRGIDYIFASYEENPYEMKEAALGYCAFRYTGVDYTHRKQITAHLIHTGNRAGVGPIIVFVILRF